MESKVKKSCVFCELPLIKERAVAKNKLAFAFLTNIPITPGHILISPIRCVSTFDEMTEKEVKAVFELRDKLIPIMKKVFGAEGFHFAWNEGKAACQNVPHFHLHMVPRKNGDEGITEAEPRKFLYRPGSREDSPEAELKAVSEMIRKAL
ncbi:MAG: Histidine triad (HIT) protein [Parcubacteria group bacterium GW2011_GWA2_47_16]|nr:MAG: Histidine triad (HIT) protein [Parcubacteria group bacterium GW2011_GWA2_47_16]